MFVIFFGDNIVKALKMSGNSGGLASTSLESPSDDFVEEPETGIFGGPFSGL